VQHPAALSNRAMARTSEETAVADMSMTFGTPQPESCTGRRSGRDEGGATGTALFTDLIDRFGQEIYRFACQLTGNGNDADDLYQETLLKAFRAFDRLPGDANHRAWLYRICSNTLISDRRKHGRVTPMNDLMADTLADSTPDHAGALDARDLLKDVNRFVDDLPPKQRVALVLRKHHEYGYAEIAGILNSSEAAARANVHEALTKLRNAFAHRLEV
jgi:RNA polymerase sigma-70 factor, ECF subfamily